jgi:hypothetical protein
MPQKKRSYSIFPTLWILIDTIDIINSTYG